MVASGTVFLSNSLRASSLISEDCDILDGATIFQILFFESLKMMSHSDGTLHHTGLEVGHTARNLFCYVNSMRVKKPMAQGGSFIPPWAIGLREFSADIVWDFKGPDMRAVSYT